MFSGALLGAIFGLMGTIASVMAFIEGFADKAYEKYQGKVHVSALKRFTRKYFELYRPEIIDSNEKFSSDKGTCNTTKVFPLVTTIFTSNT